MKAVIAHKFGGPEVLKLEDVPVPEPKNGEILIEVRAVSVNPVDFKMRSGKFGRGKVTLPVTLGRDVAGTVKKIGAGVDRVQVGEEVYAFLSELSGGYAQYALAKSNEVAPKRSSLDYVEAAAVPLAAITAWQGLFDHGSLQAGQTVLIHGASGGVGLFAIQFAKNKGATVIATAGPDHIDVLREMGADQAIDHKNEKFEDKAKNVDLVLDLIGGETQDRSWQTLRKGGILVSTLGEPPAEKAIEYDVTAKGFMAQPKTEQLVEIGRLIDAGTVKVVISKTFPLAQVAAAHEELEKNHTSGKIVLLVPEAAAA
ncbi:MAG TPA: NADP-dependent oxidoreductase [Opitutaceae bacterium]|jgi:NADPH:quinone reductase-like Zn-dependent oxidoreductase|nr:NADP-dependent oxidoreductase [Opitutaceae bacterium]